MAGLDDVSQEVTTATERSRCPRCEVCGVVVRVRGVDRQGVFCGKCTGEVLPFVGIVSESEFKGALREYREGIGSRAGDFQDLRFDPFDEEIRAALKGIDVTLKGCAYTGGDEISSRHKKMAKGVVHFH